MRDHAYDKIAYRAPQLEHRYGANVHIISDPLALRSGGHFHHRQLRHTHPAVSDHAVQDGLLAACHGLTGQALVTNSPRADHETERKQHSHAS